MMMNCKHASRLMSEELDRPLNWRERLALRLYLLFCDGCRNFRRQMAFLRDATRRWRDNFRSYRDVRRRSRVTPDIPLGNAPSLDL